MQRLIQFLILFLLMLSLIGCAVGNIGTLAAKVQSFDKVRIIDVYALGLHFRTRTDDAGMQFGYSKRRYVFFNHAKTKTGWYFFHIPLPDIESLSQDLVTFGIEISTVPPESGISLGYQHTVLQARVQPWTSVFIEYKGNLPLTIEVRRP